MIGLLTIGLIGLALCKKRGVSGIGISRFDWMIYRDLIEKIEKEVEEYIDSNAQNLYDFDTPIFEHPRLDISVSPYSRDGYDFDIIIDEYENFKYPNRTYDLSNIIQFDEERDVDTINYDELEQIALDILERSFGQVAGIGAAYKRRVYREIENLQNDVDFDFAYEDQTDTAKRRIKEDCNFVNSQYPRRKPITPERYYKQLRRAYKAISGIGETNLPYKTYTVRNHRGDIILQHRDYGTPEQIFQDAIDYVLLSNINNSEEYGYWETVAAIATGKKFVWESKGVHRGIEKLVFGGGKHPNERKSRISYLASPKKGGMYPEVFAETIIGNSNFAHEHMDEQEILNGVLYALFSIYSVKQAKDMILETYLDAYTITESSDTPF